MLGLLLAIEGISVSPLQPESAGWTPVRDPVHDVMTKRCPSALHNGCSSNKPYECRKGPQKNECAPKQWESKGECVEQCYHGEYLAEIQRKLQGRMATAAPNASGPIDSHQLAQLPVSGCDCKWADSGSCDPKYEDGSECRASCCADYTASSEPPEPSPAASPASGTNGAADTCDCGSTALISCELIFGAGEAQSSPRQAVADEDPCRAICCSRKTDTAGETSNSSEHWRDSLDPVHPRDFLDLDGSPVYQSTKEDYVETDEQCVAQDGHTFCYPLLFVIGVQKAGTSAVYTMLSRHTKRREAFVHGMSEEACGGTVQDEQGVWAPPYFPETSKGTGRGGKEGHLLSAGPEGWKDVMAHKEKYLSCYRLKEFPSRRFMDATPEYFSTPGGAGRMAEFWPQPLLPKLRLLVVLREPIARSFSAFTEAERENARKDATHNMHCVQNTSEPTFEQEVECDRARITGCFKALTARNAHLWTVGESNTSSSGSLDLAYHTCMDTLIADQGTAAWHSSILMRSIYAPQLASWHAPKQPKIKRDQILVMAQTRLIIKPTDSMYRIGRFYGLGNVTTALQYYLRNGMPVMNEGGGDESHKEKRTDCATKDSLTSFFEPWNTKLIEDLKSAFDAGEVPEEEPAFEEFAPTSVLCGDEVANNGQDSADADEEAQAVS